MDLQELSDRTGIPSRRLRYCLDAQLLPGLRLEEGPNEVGRRRRFHEEVGFYLACAARLVEFGVTTATVRTFIVGLTKCVMEDGKTTVISRFFDRRAAGCVYLGDNLNMRFEMQFLGEEWSVGWQHPGNPARLNADYQPLGVIALDIGRIARQTCDWS